jgi:hypothetical protein
MNQFVSAAKNIPDSTTENGAATFASSNSSIVDFFFKAGASRGNKSQFIDAFSTSYKDDKKKALRALFWSRDVRGGAGERENFRHALRFLAKEDPATLQAILNSGSIENFGRWDDVLVLLEDGIPPYLQINAASRIRLALMSGDGLAAKWMPREASSQKKMAWKLRSIMGMDAKTYRKTLSSLTKVVETNMCAKDWDNIEFSHVPSVANTRYAKAFTKNTPKYQQYLDSVKKGDSKINMSAAFPHDVVRSLNGNAEAADVMWNNLPNYIPEDVNVLPIVDVSGSMSVKVSGSIRAMDIAIGLGIYTAERQTGAFKNMFLTFETQPQFVDISNCMSILTKVEKTRCSPWGGSTNFQAALDMILKVATVNNVPASDIPDVLLVASDMEFDHAEANYSGNSTQVTNFQVMKEKFAAAGYNLPQVVFWNLNSRTANIPVRFNEQGVALISGFSPAILTSVLGGSLDPYSIVLKTIMSDRYTVEKLTEE